MMPQLPSPVGLKMPIEWRDSAQWRELAGPHRNLLDYVADAGLTHVEFSCGGCRGHEERRRIRSEASECADAGLAVYLHPYMDDPEDPCRYGRDDRAVQAMNRTIETATEVAEACSTRCIVVFHPGSASVPQGDADTVSHRRRMVERAGRYLRALERRARAEGGVTPVVEHQVPPGDDEALMRVGDTVEELLEVISDTDLSLCWDTGHYLRAVVDRGQAETPPEEMFRRTGFVHLHDVVEGADHRPVTADSTGPAAFIKGLWERGYDGPVTLEYHEGPMLERGGLDTAVRTGLRVLSEWAQG